MSSKTLFEPTLNGILDIDLINIVPINENFSSIVHACMRHMHHIICEMIIKFNVQYGLVHSFHWYHDEISLAYNMG